MPNLILIDPVQPAHRKYKGQRCKLNDDTGMQEQDPDLPNLTIDFPTWFLKYKIRRRKKGE